MNIYCILWLIELVFVVCRLFLVGSTCSRFGNSTFCCVHYASCTMVTKDEIVFVESVGGVDGPPTFENVTTNSSHTKNVHIKLGNSLENEISQFTTT